MIGRAAKNSCFAREMEPRFSALPLALALAAHNPNVFDKPDARAAQEVAASFRAAVSLQKLIHHLRMRRTVTAFYPHARQPRLQMCRQGCDAASRFKTV